MYCIQKGLLLLIPWALNSGNIFKAMYLSVGDTTHLFKKKKKKKKKETFASFLNVSYLVNRVRKQNIEYFWKRYFLSD